MSQTVTLNGVSYTVPDPDDTGWGTYTTSYLTAIASNMLQKNGGSFALTNDADFGSTKGLIAAYFKSASSNIAGAGAVRLSNTDDIGFRNAGNDGDLLLSADAGTDGILTYNSVALATISATQTLTNKTLTSPVINTGISGTAIDDNTSLGSSATKVPTQNAVKSYVDAQLTASDLDFTGDTGGAQAVDLDSETLTVEGSTGIDTVSSDADGSSPKISIAIDSTVATLTGTQTLTNKTINSPKINEDVALTATSTYLNRMDATSSVQTQLNAKQATITGAATTIVSSDLTASKALQSNGSGKVEVSSVTTTELGYVSGVTSALQTQLNAKQATIDSSNRLDADLIHDGTVSNTEFGYINSLTSNAQTQLDAKAPISQPEFTSYVDFDSISAPGAPSDSGDVRLYANSSKLYFQGQGDGSPTEIGSGGGGAGDADTIQLKAANDFSAVNVAPWYTGNNPVPGGGGSIGGTWEISTSNPLINIDGKTNVFHYSNGTSNRKNDYFEIELDVPNYAKGHNLVLQLFYRTVGAEDTDFLFFARDRTADYETTTSSSGALNTITLASATGFAVGDRICIQDSSDARHFRYVTAVSGSNITFGGSAITVGSGDVVISKYFTDELDTIAAENNTTNYEGKIRKWAFQINDTTTKVRVGFIYDNSATSTNELFFDQILLSSNQFLQASSQGMTESYFAKEQDLFWDASGSGEKDWDQDLLVPEYGTPALANSKLLDIKTVGSQTNIVAKVPITLTWNIGASMTANGYISFKNQDDDVFGYQQNGGGSDNQNVFLSSTVNLDKDQYLYTDCVSPYSRTGYTNITATPLVSDCILLSSEDEIFSNWQSYTPSFGGFGSTSEVDFKWRRNGSNMEIQGYFAYGSAAASMAFFNLPSGYTADSGVLRDKKMALGTYYRHYDGNALTQIYFTGPLFYNGDDQDAVCFAYASTGDSNFDASNASTMFGSSGESMSVKITVPIAGWTSTFNPVLSMPLVDLGQPTETWIVPFTSSNNFWDGTGDQRQWNEALLKPYPNGTANTISTSNLVTVSDISSGGNTVTAITAKQDITLSVTVNSWLNSSSYLEIKTSNDETITASQQFNSSNYAGEASAIVNLKAGDYIYFFNQGYNDDGGVTFTAQKVQSGNMAHIIKPAVALLKDAKPYNTYGGTNVTGSGTWTARTLNTIEGESWFLSLSGTTGFVLNPGQYEISYSSPFYRVEAYSSRLYDSTNSSVVAMGGSGYNDNVSAVVGLSTGNAVVTVTADTTFQIQYQTSVQNTDYGLGYFQYYTSGLPSIYTQVKIRKLK